jgi:CheY-like chemotaxis protein
VANVAPIVPFRHPTTALIVDDSKLFVRSISLRIPDGVAVEIIEDPRAALERLNRDSDAPTFLQRWKEPSLTERHGERTEFDANHVEEEISFGGRFRRISVVVADYGMPAMSGLEFCSRIRDASVQKILVTGLADQGIALRAFNDRSIQRFMSKGDSKVFSGLFAAIDELREQYFVAKARYMESVLCAKLPPYATDPGVAQYLDSVCKRLRVVEHYMLREPSGLLLISLTGELHTFVVLDERQMFDQATFSSAASAPAHVVEGLASRRKALVVDYALKVPCVEGRMWDEHLIDVERLGDTNAWYVGVWSAASASTLRTRAVSFASYLEQMDTPS